MDRFILSLDQGTTSSRAIIFNHDGRVVASAQQEFEQILPAPGLVEHDPEAIWSTQLETARRAIASADVDAAQIAAIGVTNQRETTVLWDRDTGRAVAHAIVWQSRASAAICERLKADGLEPVFRERTGLLLDPYFSGTKVKLLLDSDSELRRRAGAGEILFGTIDSFLIWRLTGGRCHVTDVSNASRTLMFNIHTCQWDDELLSLLDVPQAMLPSVRASSEIYGDCDEKWFGTAIPVAGDAGDQQAATFGQACFQTGSAKNTYGTGCFLLLNTGDAPKRSENNLLTTIGWRIGDRTTYCLEGSVFIGGAVVQWLRDGLGLIETSGEVETLAASVPDADGVFLVPAFVGLGAPYWDPYARGAIVGITRSTNAGHLARAAVESMALQSRDVLEAMQKDAGLRLAELKVDGGASVNDALLQFQADMIEVVVRRPVVSETTALGAAYLAGLAVGYWHDLDEIEERWTLDREYVPSMLSEQREKRYKDWQRAVRRSLAWARPEESLDDRH
ncbi:MAG: glycerol kinase GlpK [Planctomycetota bacterium]|nr:glycerol kinase GlpK [Planctomycetota bacterium]